MPTVTLNLPDTTFISSGQPNSNFSFYPLVNVGSDMSYLTCIGLINIALPQLTLSSVESAILNLSVITKTGAAPSQILVYKATQSYDTATVTYNTQPAMIETQVNFDVSASQLYTSIHINITSLVNEWLSGEENNGVALVSTDGTTEVQFATNNIVYQPYFPTLTLTYSDSPVVNTGYNLAYEQLAHVIEQIIDFYPTNVLTVFTRGLTASSITGTPYQLYKSTTGTYGAIFILTDEGQQEAIPINAITAIYTGDGSVYNPAFTYLQLPQKLAPGFDTNLITAHYEYLPINTEVTLYTGSNVHASGEIYKNEYGIIVLSDADGNTPIFMPVYNINVILPVFTEGLKQKNSKPKVSIEIAK